MGLDCTTFPTVLFRNLPRPIPKKLDRCHGCKADPRTFILRGDKPEICIFIDLEKKEKDGKFEYLKRIVERMKRKGATFGDGGGIKLL